MGGLLDAIAGDEPRESKTRPTPNEPIPELFSDGRVKLDAERKRRENQYGELHINSFERGADEAEMLKSQDRDGILSQNNAHRFGLSLIRSDAIAIELFPGEGSNYGPQTSLAI
jgi:hypothetical protein